jgi:hypothetical protein
MVESDDPVTIGLMVAGGVVQARAQQQAGEAQNIQAQNEARIAEFNAQVARRQGEAEAAALEAKARRQAKKGERVIGTARAAIGKSGVAFSGSTLAVLADTATELERDRLTILRESILARQRGESRAAGLGLEAQAARTRGKALKRAGKTKALGTLLSAGGKAAGGF